MTANSVNFKYNRQHHNTLNTPMNLWLQLPHLPSTVNAKKRPKLRWIPRVSPTITTAQTIITGMPQVTRSASATEYKLLSVSP
jgi:hypothetical protein